MRQNSSIAANNDCPCVYWPVPFLAERHVDPTYSNRSRTGPQWTPSIGTRTEPGQSWSAWMLHLVCGCGCGGGSNLRLQLCGGAALLLPGS